jgi:chromate transporter
VTLLKLFGTLFAVNLLTVGGGYVMLPLLHGLFVERYAWLSPQEFVDAVAIGQLTPGPLTTMNAFIGFKVAGLAGAVTATAASYLPSLLVVTLVARSYERFRSSQALAAVLAGVRPAVVGMLLAVLVDLARVAIVGPVELGICLASFAVASWGKLDPSLVVLTAGVGGALLL